MSLRIWARAVKRDTIAVFLAARDPRVPWITERPASRVAGAVIVMIWIGVLALGFWWGWHASVLRRSR